MPGAGETYWHCAECGTQWDTLDLVTALRQMKLDIEETEE